MVLTGGLTEIRVRNDNAFAAYAFFLKNFREELFSRSMKWSFPLESFLTELDSLVKFYVKIFNLIENKCVKVEEKEILGKQLIEPLALFFKSVDSEFGINYFQNSVEKFKADKSSDIVWIDYSIGQALDKMAYGEDTRAEIYQDVPKAPLPGSAIEAEKTEPKKDDDLTPKEPNAEHRVDQCPECIVRDNDSSEKKVFRCKFCEKWLCEKHLAPRACYFPNLKAPDRIKATYLSEKDREDGHPDPVYTEREGRPFISQPITPTETEKQPDHTPDVEEKKPREFGTCPHCQCTDSEVVEDYSEKTILKCWNCHLVYGQKRNPPYPYIELSKPVPVPKTPIRP